MEIWEEKVVRDIVGTDTVYIYLPCPAVFLWGSVPSSSSIFASRKAQGILSSPNILFTFSQQHNFSSPDS